MRIEYGLNCTLKEHLASFPATKLYFNEFSWIISDKVAAMEKGETVLVWKIYDSLLCSFIIINGNR